MYAGTPHHPPPPAPPKKEGKKKGKKLVNWNLRLQSPLIFLSEVGIEPNIKYQLYYLWYKLTQIYNGTAYALKCLRLLFLGNSAAVRIEYICSGKL